MPAVLKRIVLPVRQSSSIDRLSVSLYQHPTISPVFVSKGLDGRLTAFMQISVELVSVGIA